MNLEFLNSASNLLNKDDLDTIEQLAVTSDNLEHRMLGKLVSYARHLEHQLADPNYLYAGRIHRQALMCRDAGIDKLRKEILELKKDNAALIKTLGNKDKVS